MMKLSGKFALATIISFIVVLIGAGFCFVNPLIGPGTVLIIVGGFGLVFAGSGWAVHGLDL